MHYHKANIFAIAFSQLQLFNKPFPTHKCSNHSSVVASEAISGCWKCWTKAHVEIQAHVEIHNVRERFSGYLLAEQFLSRLLPFPDCLFQPGVLRPLHPAT